MVFSSIKIDEFSKDFSGPSCHLLHAKDGLWLTEFTENYLFGGS
jgi:hypothetical protein